MGAGELRAVDERVSAELDQAVAEAEREQLPDPVTAMETVYADPPAQPAPWYRQPRDA